MRLFRPRLPLFVLGLLAAAAGSSLATASEPRSTAPRDAEAFERFGPYPVGVRTLVLVDTSRTDERAGGFRTLVTEVWYPAAPEAAGKKPVTFSEFFAPHEEAASRFVRRFRAELEDVDRRFSSRAVRDAPVAEGVFPLLVFSHGNGGVRHQNTFQLDHLASHGYVIASPDHTGNAGIAPLPDRAVFYDRGGRSYAAAERPKDVSFVIDRLLAANADRSSFLYGSLDAETIGALGHSFGGFTVCRAAATDSRIRAILPMTVAWGKIIDVPVFVFLAGRDETVGAIGNGAAKLYYQSARGPKYLLTIERGGHFSFTDMDAIRPNFGDGISKERGPDARFLPVDEAKAIIRRYGLAFFEAYLRGAADALRFLETDPASREIAYEHERAAPVLDEAIVRTSDSSNDDERSPAQALARSGGPENEPEAKAQEASASGEDEKEPARPIRILLVTGADVPAHDWRATTPVTREALEESKTPVDVRVCEDPAILETDALHSYDVVVLNFRTPPPKDPSERARENLARFVRSGKGLVAIHFAVYAFSTWDEYPRMIGRVWVGRRDGEKISGHGPRGPFRVRVARPKHPIVQGIEDFEADDELYAKLVGDAKIEVLLEADSDWSGRTEPIAWTRRYGEGRVFVTVLGHDAAARKTEPFKKLLEQGTRWAAGRLEEAAAGGATAR